MRNVIPFKSKWGNMNLPDDWGMYFVICPQCGRRYHKSEYGCSYCEEEYERIKEEEYEIKEEEYEIEEEEYEIEEDSNNKL